MPKVEGFALEYCIPDELASRFATHVLVQRTDHEVVLSFFEAQLPPISGEPDEIAEQIKERGGKLRAECVARVTMAASRMPDFVQALQKTLEAHRSHSGGAE